jgi:cytochrome b
MSAARMPLAIRLFHGGLAVGFIGAWALESPWRAAHEWLGYAAAALVLWRLGYALSRADDWGWRALLKPPQAVWRYAAQALRGRAPQALGYNPLAAWNILAMLTLVLLIAASGFALTTDRFWGDEAMQAAHALLVDAMTGLLGLHLLGVGVGSVRSRHVLPRTLWSGERAPH